jgi:hypothetical protein
MNMAYKTLFNSFFILIACCCAFNHSSRVLAQSSATQEEQKTVETSNEQNDEDDAKTNQDLADSESATDGQEPKNAFGAESPVGDQVGLTFSDPVATNWRVGVLVFGGSKTVRGLDITIPVPAEHPEQTVEILKEEFPPQIINAEYEDLNAGPRRLTFRIPQIAPKEKILVLVTYRVSTMQMIAPADVSVFKFQKKKSKETKPYLKPSPEITWRDSKLKNKAKELVDINDSDWKKVESIFDWIRENIETRAGDPVGSQRTFKEGSGASEDLVSLFVAMCRANKIPSRMVFVDGTQYAEFYLEDQDGNGHWFPANVVGVREFGEISEPRVVLQKGDNVRVPGEPKALKFVPALAHGDGNQPAAVRFVREPMPID